MLSRRRDVRSPPRRPAGTLRAACRGLFVTFEGIDRSGKTHPGQAAARGARRRGRSACASRAAPPPGERVRELLKDPAVELSRRGRGAAVRRRPGRAGAPGDPPGAGRRPRRGVRPLPRLLARLPGRGARPRGRRGRRRQRARHRRPRARPHAPARPRSRGGRTRARARTTASRPRARAAAQGARRLRELADADPGRWRRIDADREPDEVHADVLAAVRAARAGAATA